MDDEKLPTLWRPGFLRRPADKKRRPIDAVEDAVRAAELARTPGGKVVVVQAQTASGKSSLIPPMVWRKFAMERRGGPGVVCTQPRRLTAIRIAADVGGFHTDGLQLGVDLGWLTGVSARVPKQPTSLLYSTVGSASSALRSGTFEEFAQRWSYVIVDEAHERSRDLDLFLLQLKHNLAEHAHEDWCPVVMVMSATIDPDEWGRYFGAPAGGIIEVAGRTYPISENWADDAGPLGAENFMRLAAEKVFEIHERAPPTTPDRPGDIMVFLPGSVEHKELRATLEQEMQKRGGKKFRVLSIMGETVAAEGADYRQLFTPLPAEFTRRVVLASTVAETGLTVDTLLAVVDPGWNREPIYLPNEDMNGLITAPASKRAVRQRMGRAGRVAPGEFYALYSKAAFDALPEQPLPQVLNSDAAQTLVHVADMFGGRIEHPGAIDFISALPPELAQEGLDKLFALGLAAPAGGDGDGDGGGAWELTDVGRLLAPALKAAPAEAVMAAAGAHIWGASPVDVLAAAACAEAGFNAGAAPAKLMRQVLPSALVRGDVAGPAAAEEAVDAVRAAMGDANAESVLVFSRFSDELAAGNERAMEWAGGAGFPARKLYAALASFIYMMDEVAKAGVPCNSGTSLAAAAKKGPREFTSALLSFKRALEFGYRCNIARLRGTEYITGRGVHVSPPALPAYNRLPRFLLYISCELSANNAGLYRGKLKGVSVLDGFTRGAPATKTAPQTGSPTGSPAPHEKLLDAAVRRHWEIRAIVRAFEEKEPTMAPLKMFESGRIDSGPSSEWTIENGDLFIGGEKE